MRLALPVFVLLASCNDVTDDIVDGLLSSCDPLDPSVCALPFPSSHFLAADDSSVTGLRVDFASDTLPTNRDGVPTNPKFWNERDGYSINTPMMTYIEDVSIEGVVGHADLGAYLDDDVKTVVINTETGERLPHWVELDATAPADQQRLLMIRPAMPMEWNTRYVVGIRGLSTNAGGDVAVSSAFRALRDDEASDNLDVELRRPHFESDVFPVLEAEGFARGELQLAWDFHTASRDNTLGRLEWMRDDALEFVADRGFDLTITKAEVRDCDAEGESIYKDIEGTFVAPLYMVADEPEDALDNDIEALLTRDADGWPERNGTTVVDFIARIPCSVAEGPDGLGPVEHAAPVLQYGHGLLGDKGEAKTGWLARFADDRGAVILGLDWTGFMEDDVSGITFMLAATDPNKTNASHFAIISERSSQGMIEQVLGMRLATQVLVSDDALKVDGVEVIDADQPLYYGNSQGAIMGAAYVGLSPDIERAVLGVGGGPYSLLLPRSKDFDPFFLIFKNKYDDHREIMMFVAGLTQQLWDPTEPGGWMWELGRDNDRPKQILQQVAIYDNQVTTLGAHIMARAYGSYTPAPAVRDVWGIDEVDVGEDGRGGSALVEFLYEDLPDEPVQTIPPGADEIIEGTEYDDGRNLDPHECPRREPAGQEQAWTFLTTGKVVHTCEGPCIGRVADICP